MKTSNFRRIAAAAAVALCAAGADAKVVLPHFVTDSMVVQQQSLWTITGRSSGGRVKVRASWSRHALTAKVMSDGTFSIRLATPKAGGPYTITFDDGDRTTLRDIYSGEVWLCSGQSNMEMPVGGWGKVMNYWHEIMSANHPEVRFLQISKQRSFVPAADTDVNMGGWRTCTPETVENFSSVAYFYAREMARRLSVHVGVIDCTWGGTPAEAWSSYAGVSSVEGFENETGMMADNGFDKDRIKAEYERRVAEWVSMATEGVADSGGKVCLPADGSLPVMPVPGQWESSALPGFNGIVLMQREIDIPAGWAGKPVELHLGAIDDEDVTYFNGTKIAEGSGYNVERTYTVPAELVKGGKALITVRVTDFEGEGGICGSASDLFARQGDSRLPLDGNWTYKVAADFGKLPRRPVSAESASFPTVLYNAMLYPLRQLPIKGVLWYQGCANVGRAAQYGPLFRRLISDWRRLWGNDSLPFYFVQLAAYLKPVQVQPDSEWAALRQAQAGALSLDGTAMVVTTDIGDSTDIHPKNKQEVARRLSLVALRRAYGFSDITDRAPALSSCEIKGSEAVLRFDGDVVTRGEAPRGFIVLTDKGQWAAPEAVKTDARTIRITAGGNIVAVRYNWADYPCGNLFGPTGLPVALFEAGSR